ncbi:MAG: proton-conducting transporter transmembrane domain-containing protein [Myxococcales bacterium]
MTPILAAMASLGLAAAISALLARRRAQALAVSAAGCVAALAFAAPAAVRVLLGGGSQTVSWTNPVLGQQALVLDPLAAWFLLPVLFISSACAIYGGRYLLDASRPVGLQAAGMDLIVLAIMTVCLAGDALLFLAAWELMTVFAFLLLTHEHERAEVRRAGILYLVLTHAGTSCLLAMFALLAIENGSLRFLPPGALSPRAAVALFTLGAIGFGCKAGAWPLHVWLPAAHPVAPSHVSALLSGLVIKTGIYGILRSSILIGPVPIACGATLLALGVASALLGVLAALAQHELKRLLAYHSIENIGIILMGAGLGSMALAAGRPAVAAIAFAGALLHVTNHALFKSLLFLSAGAVGKACHTLQIDRLGGVLRRMPRTGLSFVVGAAAICGLPPLNGFVSEFLVYMALLAACVVLPVAGQAEAVLAFAALACVGGLAAACFAKAAGAVFLGSPRTAKAGDAREAPRQMVAPMLALAAACALAGVAGPVLLRLLELTVKQLGGVSLAATPARQGLQATAALGGALIALACAIALIRRWLGRRHPAAASVTWACGYASVGPSMQYTASSFARPLIGVFRGLLLPQRHQKAATAPFSASVALEEHAPDLVERFALEPALHGGGTALALLRRAQPTRVQSYVLAIFVALVALLWWRLG